MSQDSENEKPLEILDSKQFYGEEETTEMRKLIAGPVMSLTEIKTSKKRIFN